MEDLGELTRRVAKKDDRKARIVLKNLNASQDKDFFSLFLESMRRRLSFENDRNKSRNVISCKYTLTKEILPKIKTENRKNCDTLM